ncbi:MAG: serine/threonine-protein kinase, partial [Planctomycetota bacterium]
MRLGAYTLHEELGRGTFGVVHRATGPDGAVVAVKVLLAPDPEALARFDRERRILAQLDAAAGFVPLLDAGEGAGRPYLVMPLLEGGTLAARLLAGPLPVAEGVALASRLARALGAAHALGVIHRDLKPANVLFDRAGRAFVSDLGLARHFGRAEGNGSQASLTATGSFAGTIGYVAPEQLDDARRATPASDVFSLAAVLFECLAGRRPYPGDGPLSYARSIDAGAKRLDALRTGVPPALASAVARALARDPGQRPPDGA